MRVQNSSKLVYLESHQTSQETQDHPKDSGVCRNYSDRRAGE